MKSKFAVERPLLASRFTQLRYFYVSHKDDVVALRQLLTELTFRKRRKARVLRDRAITRLVELQGPDSYFSWPTTDAAPAGDGSFPGVEDWPKQGLLGFLGYRVGNSGIDRESRRDVLDSVYNETVPRVNDQRYMADWGEPASGLRLKKLAQSIAAFTQRAKRSGARGYSTAIRDWESDLKYLYKTYYVGRYDEKDFKWPMT